MCRVVHCARRRTISLRPVLLHVSDQPYAIRFRQIENRGIRPLFPVVPFLRVVQGHLPLHYRGRALGAEFDALHVYLYANRARGVEALFEGCIGVRAEAGPDLPKGGGVALVISLGVALDHGADVCVVVRFYGWRSFGFHWWRRRRYSWRTYRRKPVVDIRAILLRFIRMRPAALNHRLQFRARRRKSILIVTADGLLILLYRALKCGIRNLFLHAGLYFGDGSGNIVRVIQGLTGLRAAFAAQSLQLGLQRSKLLNSSVIVAFLRLIELRLELYESGSLRLVDLPNQASRIAAVLLEFTRGSPRRRELPLFQSLSRLHQQIILLYPLGQNLVEIVLGLVPMDSTRRQSHYLPQILLCFRKTTACRVIHRLLPELFFALPQLPQAGVLQGFVDLAQFFLNVGGQWPIQRHGLLQYLSRPT